jgi:hypothetical protein
MEPSIDQDNTLKVTSTAGSPPRKKPKIIKKTKAAKVVVPSIDPVADIIKETSSVPAAVTAAILPKVKKTIKVSGAVDQSGFKPSCQIIWIAALLVLLLEIVIQVGAHIASGKNTAIKWSEVHAIFFDSEECVQYKTEAFYKKDEYRKLKEKYDRVMKSIKEDISTGNQSGKSGEMSRVYELVQRIENEKDDDREEREEKKQNEEDQHKAIEKCETDVLTKTSIRLIITTII